jgi:hypothetical protein
MQGATSQIGMRAPRRHISVMVTDCSVAGCKPRRLAGRSTLRHLTSHARRTDWGRGQTKSGIMRWHQPELVGC